MFYYLYGIAENSLNHFSLSVFTVWQPYSFDITFFAAAAVFSCNALCYRVCNHFS